MKITNRYIPESIRKEMSRRAKLGWKRKYAEAIAKEEQKKLAQDQQPAVAQATATPTP